MCKSNDIKHRIGRPRQRPARPDLEWCYAHREFEPVDDPVDYLVSDTWRTQPGSPVYTLDTIREGF